MAGLPWYVVWTEFSRHGKTRDLCGRVKDRNAGMYVVRLWEHCAEHALDGRIPMHAVEDAAGWRGKDGVLLVALETSGWLDVEGDVRIVHGWVERNGSRIAKWLRDNAKPRGNKPSTHSGPARDQHGTGKGPRAGPPGEDLRLEIPEEDPDHSIGSDQVWEEVLGYLRKRVRPDTFRRVFAPLVGHRRGDSLVVEAPNRFVAENHAATLAEALAELNHPLKLEFTVAARRAAGGA